MLDEFYMVRALELAKRGRFTTAPNPNVGCVIVNNGNIIGEGWHHKSGEDHAEINALKMLNNKQTKGATIYTTMEPCSHFGKVPPCCNALIKAEISRVVAAMKDPNPQVNGRGFNILKQAGIEVNHGLMFQEAQKINRGFIKRMITGMPFIQLKMAASIDGRIAMKDGESKWITSIESRRDVQQLRAQSNAILSSGMTVKIDDPSLTIRWKELNKETKKILSQSQLQQPIRIIIDNKNLVVPNNKIIKEPGETWLIRNFSDNHIWPTQVKQIILPLTNQKIDFIRILKLLGKFQINYLLIEAGSKLSGSFIEANVIDEIIIYLAPKLLGNTSLGLFELKNITTLAMVPKFQFSNICQLGPDIRLTLVPIDYNLF